LGLGAPSNRTPFYNLFFFFSLLIFLFSLKDNLGFFITLESLNDLPLYLLDIVQLKSLNNKIL